MSSEMIPDSPKRNTDTIDLILQGSSVIQHYPKNDGTLETVTETDPNTIWCQTKDVNSERFGEFGYELMDWERQAQAAYSFMPPERAKALDDDIMAVAIPYRRAVDCKSSEAIRDKHHAKQTLVDKMLRNRVERITEVRNPVQKGFLNGFLGKRDDEEEDM